MNPYFHTVQYYETDKMGVTHHSNYIRWMEEARVDFLHQAGWDYDRLESMGIVSPVVSVECQYRKPTVFAEKVQITVHVEKFTGVRLWIGYTMQDQTGETVLEGRSEHCFLHADGSPIRMKKEFPGFYETMKELEENDGSAI